MIGVTKKYTATRWETTTAWCEVRRRQDGSFWTHYEGFDGMTYHNGLATLAGLTETARRFLGFDHPEIWNLIIDMRAEVEKMSKVA